MSCSFKDQSLQRKASLKLKSHNRCWFWWSVRRMLLSQARGVIIHRLRLFISCGTWHSAGGHGRQETRSVFKEDNSGTKFTRSLLHQSFLLEKTTPFPSPAWSDSYRLGTHVSRLDTRLLLHSCDLSFLDSIWFVTPRAYYTKFHKRVLPVTARERPSQFSHSFLALKLILWRSC